MGYARIVTGGTDGRYTIEVDLGSATKTQALDALNTLLAQLDNKLGETLGRLATAEALETEQLGRIQAAELAYIIASQTLAPGSLGIGESVIVVTFEIKRLAELKVKHAPLRLLLDAIKFDRALTLKRIAYWNQFSPLQTRDVWCTDFTEDGAADSLAATAEIPGEPGLMVLAPGCRAPSNSDGYLQARQVMSPGQAFFNAAILPGWQKFRPTYRWGTCTGINYDLNVMDVSLASQPSTAQSLGVNQTPTLAGVPVMYMECDSEVFQIGDRVVVQFQGQEWASPRVIGFLDNPRPCILWPDIQMLVVKQNATAAAGLLSRFFLYSSEVTGFSCDARFQSYVATTFDGQTSTGLNQLSLAYGAPTFVGSADFFTINSVSVPEPYVVGTENYALSGSSFPTANLLGFPLDVYPLTEARGFVVANDGIKKYTSPFVEIVVNDFAEACEIVRTETYLRFERVPVGVPLADEAEVQTDPAYFRALFDETVVYAGPPHQLLGEPTLTVTYDGPRGIATAEYERVGNSNTFRKKRVLT